MPDIFVNSPVTPQETSVEETLGYEKKGRGHHGRKLTAFVLYPEKIKFETKEKDEEVILLLRQHVIVNLGWILVTAAMIIAPFFINALGILGSLPGEFRLIIMLAWYLITLAFTLESFMGWFFNVYIVTNKRVIDIDFANLIYKEVSDANLDKIQDISYSMGGVARTIFNYGDVSIQTAAEVQEFEFKAVPDPARVTKIIKEFMEKGKV